MDEVSGQWDCSVDIDFPLGQNANSVGMVDDDSMFEFALENDSNCVEIVDDDSMFESPNVDDVLMNGQDDGMNDVNSSTNRCTKKGDKSNSLCFNMPTKKALDRKNVIEDVKNVMRENDLGTEKDHDPLLHLIELRLVVGKALGIKEPSDCLKIHPLDATRHVLVTNLMECLTKSKQDDLLLLLQLNSLVETIVHPNDNWKKTDLSKDKKTLCQVNLSGINSIRKSLSLSVVKIQIWKCILRHC